eukprot:scaffold5654_cov119-Isochrysis_galbana.AAC.6
MVAMRHAIGRSRVCRPTQTTDMCAPFAAQRHARRRDGRAALGLQSSLRRSLVQLAASARHKVWPTRDSALCVQPATCAG